ncbi:hypothetical protein THOM_2332, partial [Trachipleistophora hominis]
VLDEQLEVEARNDLERVKKEFEKFKKEQEKAERIKKMRDEYFYRKKVLFEDIKAISALQNMNEAGTLENSENLSNERHAVDLMRTFYERFRQILIERDGSMAEADDNHKRIVRELEALCKEENNLEYAIKANSNAIKNTKKSEFETSDLKAKMNELVALREEKTEMVNNVHRNMDEYMEQVRMSKRKNEIERYLSANTMIDDDMSREKISEDLKAFSLKKGCILTNRAAMLAVLVKMQHLLTDDLTSGDYKRITRENANELNEIFRVDYENADAADIKYEHVKDFFDGFKEYDSIEIPYNTLRELESAISSNKNAAHIYKDLKRLGEKRNACVLCNKPFVNNELNAYLAKLDYVIEKIPEKEREKTEEYKELLIKIENDEKRTCLLRNSTIYCEKLKILVRWITEMSVSVQSADIQRARVLM